MTYTQKNTTVINSINQKNDHNSLKFYLNTAIFGAIRGVIGLPLEHPFEVIITRIQANSQQNLMRQTHKIQLPVTGRKIFKDVFSQFGVLSGLYAGFIPNFLRQMSKYFYRFPMMIYFPKKIEEHMPKKYLNKYEGLHKILGGVLIAGFESVIICPMERLKVYLMTKQNNTKHQISEFFQKSGQKKQILKQMFTGYESLFIRSLVSWISFMYTDHQMKKFFKQHRGLQQNEALNKIDFFLCSASVGILNVFMVLPFDKIKTLYQMQGNNLVIQNTYMENVRLVYQQEKIRGFYGGLSTKMLQYIIQTGLNSSLLEYLELYIKNKKIQKE